MVPKNQPIATYEENQPADSAIFSFSRNFFLFLDVEMLGVEPGQCTVLN